MISGGRGLTPEHNRRAGGPPVKTLTWIGMLALGVGIASCRLDGKFAVGGTVTGLRGSGLVLQNSSGKYLSVAANGSFTFASGVAKGDTYSVTVRTQPSNPSQTCGVRNFAGTIAKADVTNIIVHCTQAGRFAYVANQTSNSISAYSIDATSGALTPLSGSPFASTGTSPSALAVDPNGAFLYVANSASNDISVYAIDAAGALTRGVGTIAVGSSPVAVTVDPTDHYLYVANAGSNTVSAFAIDSGTGLGTAVGASPYAVGRQPVALTTDPSGKFLYVANFGDGNVTALAINPATGTLAGVSGSPFAADAGPVSIAIDPTGTFAYVANETAASISGYSIDVSTGVLTATSGSPMSTGSSPESVAVDPTGQFLYAANVTANNRIAGYSIAADSGVLTLASTVIAGTLPSSITVDPMSQFVYAANVDSADVSVFSFDTTTGVPTSVTRSPFAAGIGPRSIVVD
jgi:6-phosphogluconolactonase